MSYSSVIQVMLEILSANRSFEAIIEKEEAMLSQIDITRLPSYRIGFRQGFKEGEQRRLELAYQRGFLRGLQLGEQRGQLLVVKRQLARRLGALNGLHVARLDELKSEQIEALSDALLDFTTLSDFDAWLVKSGASLPPM